jgi:hypothetical protein
MPQYLSTCPTQDFFSHASFARMHRRQQIRPPITESPPRQSHFASLAAASFAPGGSCSLEQVGGSAKEVRHKAERKIPGNAASMHAEGSKASRPLARAAITK